MPLAKKIEERFTYQDYISWPDNERWELIDGVPYNMTPAPSTNHQGVAGNFYAILNVSLKGKKCRPFMAPTDVVLSDDGVVQPDVLVVCDKSKITDKNIQGPPDLVIEVLSPSTALKDKREKKWLYEKYDVKEYILIDPVEMYVEQFYIRENGKYAEGNLFAPDETIKLFSLSGMKISLPEVFGIETVYDDKEKRS